MATSNQSFHEKAVITTDAIASAGKLNPQQADRFIDYVIDETQLLKMSGVRTVRFRNESWEIDKIGLGERVALPHSEASDSGIRNGVTHSKVTLTPQPIMVPFELSDEYKQHNIMGDNVEDYIIRMMARRTANNIEQLYWYGNALGPAILESEWPSGGSSTQYRKDTYFALFNGLLKQAESGNAYNAANADMNYDVLSAALLAMPNKFRKSRSDLRLFLSWYHDQKYRENVSTRATATGDAALAGNSEMVAFGMPFAPCSLLDENPIHVEHVTLAGTTPVNLAYTNISEVVVTPSTLSTSAVTPYALTTDYTVNTTTGVITRVGGGAISDPTTVKVTYRTSGRQLITNPNNIIVGIGADISIEKDRNIFKRTNEYAIHIRTAITFEETSAVVLVKNVKI